jgi:hypothetical protein
VPLDLSPDEQLVDELGSFAYDPYAFVLWAFPWGEAGTELEHFPGPNAWQARLLRAVRDKLLTPGEAILIATTSGHGVGKSALVGMLVWWAFSTRANTRGVVTANTENQLKTKTWVEIAKWHRLFIAKHLFKCTATAVFSTDEAFRREWRIDIVPWSERNTEAFAGLHNQGNRVIVIFDEGSAIPDVIYEVTEGALTDDNTEILWFLFGNPTRNKGRFRDAFPGGRFSHRWLHFKVDSRDVPFTNKEQLERWIADYGLESDFVKVRILGEFPSIDENSFISREVALAAVGRVIEPQMHMPRLIGVDVARYGKDVSVIVARQGRNAALVPPRAYQGLSVTTLAHLIMSLHNTIEADAIFVDGGGVGGGVVDVLADLGLPVYDVQFGARADGFHDGVRYANKRAEIWGLMREDLPHLSVLNQPPGFEISLVDELTAPQYRLNAGGSILLESKEEMIRRGFPSPNYADALAVTYAFPILARAFIPSAPAAPYNPYSREKMYAKP